MSVEEYERLTPYYERLEENWGKPPGNLNSDGQNLLIYGCHFGNIFVGVQPTFGYEGDPMRLLYSRSASPHHGFAAYYTYLERYGEQMRCFTSARMVLLNLCPVSKWA